MTRTDVTVALFLQRRFVPKVLLRRLAPMVLLALLGCGASMRPIPDDVEPVPRTEARSAALAQNDTGATEEDGGAHIVPVHDAQPPPCSDSRGRPLVARRIAPDRWIVARGVVDVVRNERKVVVAPQVARSGATVGVAIHDIGKDSCLGFLGFQTGDVLHTINGRVVGQGGFISPETYASIVKNGAAVVRFDRGGHPRAVVYEVQDE